MLLSCLGSRFVTGFALFALGSASVSAQAKFQHYKNSLAPYVVSPQRIVDRMLEMADLKSNETLYDLGSGDGRIIITAAQRFHVKAVGVEISDSLVKTTNDRILKLGLQNLASTIHQDMLQVDLTPADVVTIYLMTGSNEILRPNLEKYLKPGARVISHEYSIPGWKPKLVEHADEDDLHSHMIYLYAVPTRK